MSCVWGSDPVEDRDWEIGGLEAKLKRWAQLGLKIQAILRTRIKFDVGPDRDFAQRTLDELEELLKEHYHGTN